MKFAKLEFGRSRLRLQSGSHRSQQYRHKFERKLGAQ